MASRRVRVDRDAGGAGGVLTFFDHVGDVVTVGT
jgi:hypothetical protein